MNGEEQWVLVFWGELDPSKDSPERVVGPYPLRASAAHDGHRLWHTLGEYDIVALVPPHAV